MRGSETSMSCQTEQIKNPSHDRSPWFNLISEMILQTRIGIDR